MFNHRKFGLHVLVALAVLFIALDLGSRVRGLMLWKKGTNLDEMRRVSHEVGISNGRFVLSLNNGYPEGMTLAIIEASLPPSDDSDGSGPRWLVHTARGNDLYWAWRDQNIVEIPRVRKWVYLINFYSLGVDVDWAVQPSSMNSWPRVSTQPACYTALVTMPLCVIWGGALMIAAWITVRRIRRRRATAARGFSV